MKFLVAFSSPKRSAKTIDVVAKYAIALSAEVILLRVIPDPRDVGIVAQLIATDRPADKAKSQLAQVVEELKARGVQVSSELRIGQVARTIVNAAKELNVDMLFVGTAVKNGPGFSVTPRDPIVNYLVENCPISICLIKHDAEADIAKESTPAQ
jgi:nucleotide-binding universal stress UspA family protein